jgi:hypothetical protein
MATDFQDSTIVDFPKNIFRAVAVFPPTALTLTVFAVDRSDELYSVGREIVKSIFRFIRRRHRLSDST